MTKSCFDYHHCHDIYYVLDYLSLSNINRQISFFKTIKEMKTILNLYLVKKNKKKFYSNKAFVQG